MAKVLDSGLRVSEFELQLDYYMLYIDSQLSRQSRDAPV